MTRMSDLNVNLAAPAIRLAEDRRGVTAVLTALGLMVLFGFAGAAIDVGYWLGATRGLQSAADQAAYSAATSAGQSGCTVLNTTAAPQATAIAAARGYINNQNATVTTTCNNANSAYTVTITQQQPLWFTNLFLSTAPTASASATAQTASKASDICVLALDGSVVDEGVVGSDASAFWLNGSTSVNLHCGIAVDSTNLASLSTGGSSSLTATQVYLAGDMQGSPGGSSSISTSPTANNILKNQNAIADPYIGRTIPSYTCGSYSNTPIGDNGGTVTLRQSDHSAGAAAHTFCGGLSLGGNSPSTITIESGYYVIAGGSLTINSKATITGTGVTFILTGDNAHGYATLTINGGQQMSLTLTAPTSGPYGGMAFFQDRNANSGGSSSSSSSCGSGTSQNQINGGSNQKITGAIYFPNQSVCYSGNSSTSGAGQCTQLIARTISFTGNSDVKLSCTGTGVDMISVPTPQLIK